MIVEKAVNFLDDRLGSAHFTTKAIKKVFPDHWSFMLGEICMYAFMVLLVTGTYIAFFFDDSTHPVVYTGPYPSLIGRVVPAAYASVMNLSFVIPDGLLIRQMHHWACLVFITAIGLHMSRIFFTGAFRKPREMNWVFGLTLLVLALAAGFTGYSMPGDLLSGAGLRIAYSVAESIPILGTWLAFGYFGGDFPTAVMTQRLYITHVFLIPLLIIGVMSGHLGMVWRQHHTQFVGPQRTNENVVGSALIPAYAMKSVGLMIATFAVLAFMGGFFTINPIWLYGPFDPWTIASPAAPDWYVAWLDGFLRLGPSWAIVLWGHTIPPLFFSAVVPPAIVFGLLFAWPWIEKRFTPTDRADHHLLNKPFDVPWRLGAGVAMITFLTVAGVSSSDDVMAKFLHIHVETLMPILRGCIVVLPIAFGLIAVSIGQELKARLNSDAGLKKVRRATLVRNANGGYDEEAQHTLA